MIEANQDDLRVKVIVLEKQENQQSIMIEVRINLNQQFIDLSTIFSIYCPIHNHKISIYDPNANKFVSLQRIETDKIGKVPKSYLDVQIVMIRYKLILKNQSSQSESVESSQETQKSSRKDRSKQRTIREVIELVGQWRKLHLEDTKRGFRKMNLVEAAKAVGISKKSLDDYYYQLRIGQLNNFDFNSNLDEKIGVLRTFVKEFRPEKIEKHKNFKHPRSLKIIQEMDLQPQRVEQNKPTDQSAYNRRNENEMVLQQEWNSLTNPIANEAIISYENQFYRNFQFLLDQPDDPFFQIDRDFHKKVVEESNDYFQF